MYVWRRGGCWRWAPRVARPSPPACFVHGPRSQRESLVTPGAQRPGRRQADLHSNTAAGSSRLPHALLQEPALQHPPGAPCSKASGVCIQSIGVLISPVMSLQRFWRNEETWLVDNMVG